MFEDKLQNKIFGLKMDEVSEQFMILHNEGLRDLYRSPVMKYLKLHRHE